MNSIHQGFTRWAKAGIWEPIFQVLLADPNNTYIMIDSTIIRAHQQSAGALLQKWESCSKSLLGLGRCNHQLFFQVVPIWSTPQHSLHRFLVNLSVSGG